jgi:DHA2 family multidrug resistance protein
MLSTFLQRLQQTHQTYLTAHASTSNPIFTGQAAALTQNFTRQGMAPNRASMTAYSLLSRSVSLQATTLAYVDIISFGVVLLVFLVPFAFLMQRPPKGGRAPAAAH